VMYLSIGLAGACLLAAIVQGAFPLWLGIVLLVSIAISTLFRPETDMRGTVTTEVSGGMQIQGVFVMNATITIWLAQVILVQQFPAMNEALMRILPF